MNGTIKRLLRVAQYQDRNWLDVLDIVEMAVNNATLEETDFSPYYLTYGYHPTFYHDLQEFTGAEKRMKEQPRQFVARLLADWNHVYEIFRKTKTGMCNGPNTSRHTDSMCETWSSSALQNIHATNSDPNIHWHPRRRDPSLLKLNSDHTTSRSTYHLGSLADSTTPFTRAT